VQKIKCEYVGKSTFNNMIIYLDFKCDLINYEKYKDIILKCKHQLELRVINLDEIEKYFRFTTLLYATFISIS